MLINHCVPIKRKFLTSLLATADNLAYGHRYDYCRPPALSVAAATFKLKCLTKNFQTTIRLEVASGPLSVLNRLFKAFCLDGFSKPARTAVPQHLWTACSRA